MVAILISKNYPVFNLSALIYDIMSASPGSSEHSKRAQQTAAGGTSVGAQHTQQNMHIKTLHSKTYTAAKHA
jgi:hypothetical protein